MRHYEVIPHQSIGPVRLGMHRDDVRRILGSPSSIQAAYEKWGIQFPDTDFFFKNAFRVEYDTEGRSVFLEVSAEADYTVTFDGVPVHDSAPEMVVEAIRKHAEVDDQQREYPTNLWFPDILLNLYREHSEHEKFWTIGIRRRDAKADDFPQ